MVNVPDMLLLIAVVVLMGSVIALASWYLHRRSLMGAQSRGRPRVEVDPMIAAAIADGALASVPLAEAALTMNSHVFTALDRWVVHSDTPWSLVDYVKDHHATIFSADNGFIDGLKGYVGESIVADHFAALGHHVVLATTTNEPGWDMLIDGHEYQVKTGETAAQAAQHALTAYPDIPIITDPQAAAHLALIEPHAITAVHEIGAAQLESTTLQTVHGLEAIAHAGQLHVPFITIGFSASKELRLLIDGHTTFHAAVAHVALDAFGVAAGMAIGTKTGILVGTFGGPHVMAVTGIVGSIIGAAIGKLSSKALKEAAFKRLFKQYNLELERAQFQFNSERQIAIASFKSSVVETNKSLLLERRECRRDVKRRLRTLLRAKRRASFHLGLSARWLALLNTNRRHDIQQALRVLSVDAAAGASRLATVLNQIETNGSTAPVDLRRRLAEFIAVYGNADATLRAEQSRYVVIVQRHDAQSRAAAARVLSDLAEKAKRSFVDASELKEKLISEGRAIGKPILLAPPQT